MDALAIGTEYTALTYNIGFGAYTPDFSFFMDGGESLLGEEQRECTGYCAGSRRSGGVAPAGFCPD